MKNVKCGCYVKKLLFSACRLSQAKSDSGSDQPSRLDKKEEEAGWDG